MMLWFLFYVIITIILVPVLGLCTYMFFTARRLGTFDVHPATQDSIILISGCDSGIGRCTARRMASKGFHVIAGIFDDKSRAEVEGEVPGHITCVQLDITKPESVDRLKEQVEEIMKQHPSKKLVGLVNNAGIAVYGPLEFITPERMHLQIDVNTLGHHTMTCAFLSLLRSSKGRIVNTVSIAGRICSELMGPYNASKFAMEALTNCQRLELQHFGISVSAIEPGFIKTPLVEGAAMGYQDTWSRFPPEAKELYCKFYELGANSTIAALRMAGSVELVADAIEDALTSPRPKTRYLVGRDARVYAFMVWLLPDRWLDAIMVLIRVLLPKQPVP